eukprot:5396995-Pleurochrysis_carterae.AAC.1
MPFVAVPSHRNTQPSQPSLDINSGTGLPSFFRAAVVPRGPPMPTAAAIAALRNYLSVVIPRMQKLLWHACRPLHVNRGGAAKRIAVLQPLPAAIGIAMVDWFAQRFPSSAQSQGAAGKAVVERYGKKMCYSVLLSPDQVRDLCAFEFVAHQGMGFGHMLILSSQGDVRFVRAIVVRFVQTVVQDARRCVERLELLLATWELNGLTGAITTGPQLPYLQGQWAQCVGEAKKTLYDWPAAARKMHLSRPLRAWIRSNLTVPPPQKGLGSSRLMASHLEDS